MIELQQYFGARVRELREAARMTQAELARAIPTDQPRLPAIEQGTRDMHLSTMHKIARALGVPLRDLLPPD
jgi:transcriptional regulator with XRE-family HTH domain